MNQPNKKYHLVRKKTYDEMRQPILLVAIKGSLIFQKRYDMIALTVYLAIFRFALFTIIYKTHVEVSYTNITNIIITALMLL